MHSHTPPCNLEAASGAQHSACLGAAPSDVSRRADVAPATDEAPRLVIDSAVSQVFSVDVARLRAATRGVKGVAQARQVAMYIAHVGLGFSLTDVGRVFRRDRTTVAHACAVIEDLRDQPSFDFALQCLESVVRHQMEARGALDARMLRYEPTF